MKFPLLLASCASLILLATPSAKAALDAGVKVTVAKQSKSATFTITNTGSFEGGFTLKRETKFVFSGPSVDHSTKKRVEVTYLLNGSPMKSTTGFVNLAAGGTATVTIRLRIIGTTPIVYTRSYKMTVTATQTKFPAVRRGSYPVVTDSASTQLMLKGTKGK